MSSQYKKYVLAKVIVAPNLNQYTTIYPYAIFVEHTGSRYILFDTRIYIRFVRWNWVPLWLSLYISLSFCNLLAMIRGLIISVFDCLHGDFQNSPTSNKENIKTVKMRREDDRAMSPVRTIEMMNQMKLLSKKCEQETWSI